MNPVYRLKSKNTLYSYLLSFLFVALLLAITVSLFTIYLCSVDDTTMRSFISGETSGWPDAHCYFLCYPLSYLLAFLYRINRVIPWYGMMLLCGSLYSFFLIVERLLEHFRKIYVIVVFSFLYFTLLLTYVTSLEWTKIAGLLAAAAVFRYCTLPDKLSRKALAVEYILTAAALIWAYNIRAGMVKMFLPVIFFVWLRRIIMVGREKNHKLLLINAVFAAVCLLLMGVSYLVNSYAYSSPEYKEFSEYNHYRAEIYDYYGFPDYDTYSDFYKEIGVSEETLNLLENDYDLLIPEGSYDVSTLKAIAEKASEIYFDDDQDSIDRMFSTAVSYLGSKTLLPYEILLVAVMVISFLLCRYNKWDNLFRQLILLTFFAIYLYLSYKGRLKDRVVTAIFISLILFFLGEIIRSAVSPESELLRKLAFAAVPVALIVGLNLNLILTDYESMTQGHKVSAVRSEYYRKNSENIYIVDSKSFSGYTGRNFNNYSKSSRAQTIGIGGWKFNHPLYNYKEESMGMDNIPLAVMKNDNVYYVCSESRRKGIVNRINAYYKSLGIDIRAVKVDTIDTEDGVTAVLQLRYTATAGESSRISLDSENSQIVYHFKVSEAGDYVFSFDNIKVTGESSSTISDSSNNSLSETKLTAGGNNELSLSLKKGEYEIRFSVSGGDLSLDFSVNKE